MARDKALDELVRLAVINTSGHYAVPSTAHVVILKLFVAWAATHRVPVKKRKKTGEAQQR